MYKAIEKNNCDFCGHFIGIGGFDRCEDSKLAGTALNPLFFSTPSPNCVYRKIIKLEAENKILREKRNK